MEKYRTFAIKFNGEKIQNNKLKKRVYAE